MLTYWRVYVGINEDGGMVPMVGGLPGILPRGSVFHVLGTSKPGDPALSIVRGELSPPSDWVQLDHSQALALFRDLYGRAASGAEVP